MDGTTAATSIIEQLNTSGEAGDYVAVIAQAIFNSAMRLAKSFTPKSIKATHPSHATVQPKHRVQFPNVGLVATALAVRPAKGQGPPLQYTCITGNFIQEALAIAVTHGGDSDSTGAIAGNMLGLLDPAAVVRHRWAETVEGSDLVTRLVRDFRRLSSDIDAAEELFQYYPGG